MVEDTEGGRSPKKRRNHENLNSSSDYNECRVGNETNSCLKNTLVRALTKC